MPTKKRKYNARFPAGRIKKIMQTDEEVGKVAQAVPIIISRTLELFVESLLSKAMQVTVARNAKTLSPSHVKQCILAESKFDFLRDLVKNIPDVSAAEEKEMMSAESSPNTSRFADMPAGPPRRIAREDSNSSSSSDVKIVPISATTREQIKRALSTETELPNKTVKTETVTSTSTDVAIDLSKKTTDDKPVVTANFYQETLLTDEVQHRSVITVNPSYTSPQPSTSYTKPEPLKLEPVPKPSFVDKPLTIPRIPVAPSPRTPITLGPRTPITQGPRTPTTPGPRTPITVGSAGPRTPITAGSAGPKTPITAGSAGPKTPITVGPRLPITAGPRTPITPGPRTPVTPILNIDFTKNLSNPEIKLLDTTAVSIVTAPKNEKNSVRQLHRQNSKPAKPELKKIEIKPIVVHPVDIDSLNSGNLQIDEDYDT